jgi:hypothetical protein
MMNAVKVAAACGALLLALPAAAEDTPVPRMFKGMQKGQWKADIEASASKSGKPIPSMIICTDNLLQHSNQGSKAPESGCKRRILRDTDKEMIVESQCPERSSTVTMKKQDAKNVLVAIESTGKRGHQSMKIHYTYLGACAAGQGAVSYDKNSEQCKKIRAAAAKMDPVKEREQIAKMKAMCP